MDLKDLNTPQKRLRYFVEKYFDKKKDFAIAIGIKPQDLTPYINTKEESTGKRITLTDHKKIERIKELGLNPEWYVSGEGSPLLSKSSGNIMLDVDTKAVTFYLPDISNMTIEQLFSLKDRYKKSLKTIDKFLENIDNAIKRISSNI
ncbi:MAG: hypothetical protein KIT33_15810 [Candidatus Kapabacteria bacterium]|nr:hypothetical protein [Ignavibacteriota bacterium]MCW5886437.1 hypothetical protein [Candidatus Kapabacteria bacterium]